MIDIPEKARYLLARETRAFAFLALTLKDGTPQVTPLWFDWDGEHILINTARGRVKDRVLRRRGKVALAIVDPQNFYTFIQLRGTVTEETEAGGYDEICDLAEKYRGKREYPRNPGEVRVTYKITPDSFSPRARWA